MEQVTDSLNQTHSDDSLRIDSPDLHVFPTQHIPRQTPPKPFRTTDAGVFRSLRVDALAPPWRVLAACLDDSVSGIEIFPRASCYCLRMLTLQTICGNGVERASFKSSTSTTKRIQKRVLRESLDDPDPD